MLSFHDLPLDDDDCMLDYEWSSPSSTTCIFSNGFASLDTPKLSLEDVCGDDYAAPSSFPLLFEKASVQKMKPVSENRSQKKLDKKKSKLAEKKGLWVDRFISEQFSEEKKEPDLLQPRPVHEEKKKPDLLQPPPVSEKKKPDLLQPRPVHEEKKKPNLLQPPPVPEKKKPDLLQPPPVPEKKKPDLLQPPPVPDEKKNVKRPAGQQQPETKKIKLGQKPEQKIIVEHAFKIPAVPPPKKQQRMIVFMQPEKKKLAVIVKIPLEKIDVSRCFWKEEWRHPQDVLILHPDPEEYRTLFEN